MQFQFLLPSGAVFTVATFERLQFIMHGSDVDLQSPRIVELSTADGTHGWASLFLVNDLVF